MTKKKIHYAGPWITEVEVAAVEDAIRRGFYDNYRVHVGRLERELCEYLGVKHAVAVNSGTAALHLGMASIGIGEGDEVILPDASCVATAMPVLYAGATPVFVDVDLETWCLSPREVRRAITARTRAVMPVHWNGHPCAMGEIMAIARDHELAVIEDGAPSLGAECAGRKIGTFGDTAAFSFQGAKVAIGGQGGVMVTNSDEAAKKARCLAAYGRTDSVMTYWSDHLGYNYGMPNLSAALATAQVQRIGELVEKKRSIASWYEARLNGAPRLRFIREAAGTRSTYCYPAMLLGVDSKLDRKALLAALLEDGIDARPAQPRMSRMPMFRGNANTPVCAEIEARGVILPGAFCLVEEDVDLVCRRLLELV